MPIDRSPAAIRRQARDANATFAGPHGFMRDASGSFAPAPQVLAAAQSAFLAAQSAMPATWHPGLDLTAARETIRLARVKLFAAAKPRIAAEYPDCLPMYESVKRSCVLVGALTALCLSLR